MSVAKRSCCSCTDGSSVVWGLMRPLGHAKTAACRASTTLFNTVAGENHDCGIFGASPPQPAAMRALATTIVQMRAAIADLAARAASSSLSDQLWVCCDQGSFRQGAGAIDSKNNINSMATGALSCLPLLSIRGPLRHRTLLRAPLLPLPPRAFGAPCGARGYAAGAARDELIDQRLQALCQELEAMQRQLHGGSPRGATLDRAGPTCMRVPCPTQQCIETSVARLAPQQQGAFNEYYFAWLGPPTRPPLPPPPTTALATASALAPPSPHPPSRRQHRPGQRALPARQPPRRVAAGRGGRLRAAGARQGRGE